MSQRASVSGLRQWLGHPEFSNSQHAIFRFGLLWLLSHHLGAVTPRSLGVQAALPPVLLPVSALGPLCWCPTSVKRNYPQEGACHRWKRLGFARPHLVRGSSCPTR